jgi:hypothetical protein
MAIEDQEMFGLGLPPGLPGARFDLEPPEEFEMFGLGEHGDTGDRVDYDYMGRVKRFFHESISQVVVGAIGFGIFSYAKGSAIKTAGAVAVGVALANILSRGYANFVPTEHTRTKGERDATAVLVALTAKQAAERYEAVEGRAGSASGVRQSGNQPQMMPFTG